MYTSLWQKVIREGIAVAGIIAGIDVLIFPPEE